MGELKEAMAKNGLQLVRAMREGDGCPPEADEALNNSSRAAVSAMHAEHGQAWLGDINPRNGSEVRLWLWTGEPVLNFGADFVVPAHDDELVRLIDERIAARYDGVAADVPRVQAIMERVRALGGAHLVWS